MGQVLFERCALLDTKGGSLLPDHHVLVEDDRIVEVSDRPIRANDALTLDVGGRTLMPGLIDAHVHPTITTMDIGAATHRPVTLVMHEARVILEGMLARGFTTVRDAAGGDHGLAAAVDQGPHQRARASSTAAEPSARRAATATSGPWRTTPACAPAPSSPTGLPTSRTASTASARRLREELRKGAHAIKVMASGGVASPTDPVWNTQYSREEIRAIVEEAASWHTYVLAHAYTSEAIARAVEEGVRTIEHGNLIDRPTAEAMAQRGAYVVPTLVTYDAMERFGRDFGFPEVSMGKIADVREDGLKSSGDLQGGRCPHGPGHRPSGRAAPSPVRRVPDTFPGAVPHGDHPERDRGER